MSKVTTDESVERMLADHEGEWIAFRVTERDEHGTPVRGELLAHSLDSGEVYEAIGSPGEVCILYSGEWPPNGEGFIFAL